MQRAIVQGSSTTYHRGVVQYCTVRSTIVKDSPAPTPRPTGTPEASTLPRNRFRARLVAWRLASARPSQRPTQSCDGGGGAAGVIWICLCLTFRHSLFASSPPPLLRCLRRPVATQSWRVVMADSAGSGRSQFCLRTLPPHEFVDDVL